MFTGIIQSVGDIATIENKGDDLALFVNVGQLPMDRIALGDSIAVNGVCLTVVTKNNSGFAADVSGESINRTTIGQLSIGSRVNLEMALTLQTPLGGHLVSGHVDGVGTISHHSSAGRSEQFKIVAPDAIAKYIAEKGSICVDGISLTVNAVSGAEFDLNIVPHTLQETTMGEFKVGRKVNLEVDIIARYLERLMLGDKAAMPSGEQTSISREFLQEHGFN